MSIEDVQAFEIDENRTDMLSMVDLAVLAILSNGYPDLQFKEDIIYKLVNTALYVQRIDKKWDMLKNAKYLQDDIPLKETNNQLLNSFIALSFYIPTREWDDILLKFSFNYISSKMFELKFDKNKIYDLKTLLKTSIEKDCKDGLLAGMDMHPYPNLLILFQGSLPFIPFNPELHTTRTLWSFIWRCSSGINFRLEQEKLNDNDTKLLKILKNIQHSLLYPESESESDIKYINKNNKNKYVKSDSNIPSLTKRIAFILLFGEKRTHIYKKKRYEMIISGCNPNDREYCKVKIIFKNESKYLEGDLRDEIELDYLKNFNDEIQSIQAPSGYKWIWGDKKKIKIKSDVDKNNKIKFYVDDIEIKPYDASNVLIKLDSIVPLKIPDSIKDIVYRALYMDDNIIKDIDDYQINMLMRNLHEKEYPLFDWIDIALKSKIPSTVWKSVYIKLYNNKNNEILIGPVDGQVIF